MDLWSFKASYSFAEDETSDILTALPAHDLDEPSERAAVANLLLAIPAIPKFLDLEADAERPNDLRQVVRDYLALVPIEEIRNL